MFKVISQKSWLLVALFAMLMAISACATENPPSGESTTDTSATETGSESSSESETGSESSSESETGSESSSESEATTKLNLNTVTGDELLDTIPDFGNRMVHEFMEYRPYISIQQFRREIGKYVDDAQVADYEQYVYVPVQINDSDAETLMQLSGVDAAVADELMAARPYESNADFLEKLTELTSADEATAAETYLESE